METQDELDLKLLKDFANIIPKARQEREDLLKQDRDLMLGMSWADLPDDIGTPVRQQAMRLEIFRMVLYINERPIEQVVQAFEQFERSMVFIRHEIDLKDQPLMKQIQVSENFVRRIYRMHLSLTVDGQKRGVNKQTDDTNKRWN